MNRITSAVTNIERNAIKAVMRFKTVLHLECMHCREVFGYIEGGGVWGTSSGTCPACQAKGLTSILGVSVSDLEKMREVDNAKQA